MNSSPSEEQHLFLRSILPRRRKIGEIDIVSPRPMHHIKRSILKKLMLRMEKEECLCG